MDRYTMHEELGKGSFGSVFRATSKKDGKLVAIKKLFQKFDDWNTVRSLREYRALIDLPKECWNLCQIYEIMREPDGTLYYAMEIMPSGSLKDYIESFWPPSQQSGDSTPGSSGSIDGSKQIDPSSIQSILRQVLQALKYIHSKGYMHRDLKPENILMNGKVCKVTDFSLTRTMASHTVEKIERDSSHPSSRTGRHQQNHQPQHGFVRSQKAPPRRVNNAIPQKMTSYVSTRWYRAPEIILCAPQYSAAIDIFALGCVMAELYRLVPLLPGSSEIPQLAMICELWGGPPHWYQDWPEGRRLAQKMGLEVVDIHHHQRDIGDHKHHHLVKNERNNLCRSNLRAEVPSACERALTLMENCLKMNPDSRPTASEALQHDFFQPSLVVVKQHTSSSSYQISSITPSPVPPDMKIDAPAEIWLNDGASFLNSMSPTAAHTSTGGFRNQVHHHSWDENGVPASMMMGQGMDRALFSLSMQSSGQSPTIGFLSPFTNNNIGNTSWKSIGSDKASLLMRSFDSQKRPYPDSIIQSHRKKRGHGYKPACAFTGARKY